MLPRLIVVEIVILTVQASLYVGCEYLQHNHRDVKRDIDDKIPLVPCSAFIYIMWFPLIALYPIALFFLSRYDYSVYQISIIICALVSPIIYTLFPTRFERPVLGNSSKEWLLSVVYSFDFKGSNCVPSMHCVQCFIIILSVCCCPNLHGIAALLIICLCLAIIVSTLLTKQHALLDVVTALPTAILMYAVARAIVGHFGYTQILSLFGLQ